MISLQYGYRQTRGHFRKGEAYIWSDDILYLQSHTPLPIETEDGINAMLYVIISCYTGLSLLVSSFLYIFYSGPTLDTAASFHSSQLEMHSECRSPPGPFPKTQKEILF